MHSDVILWIVVGTAIAFDFTNGFHDTANSIATSVSTRAMSPRVAVAMAASLNFVGAFLSLAVAATIAKGIVDSTAITLLTVFAGLIGAIAWNLDDLVVRAALVVLARPDRRDGRARRWPPRGPAPCSGKVSSTRSRSPRSSPPCWRWPPPGWRSSSPTASSGASRPAWSTRGFRLGQLATSALFALSHGTNDAQKTMGIIFLALVTNGNLSADADIPTWVVVSSATAIALGTYFGGWRIVRTMGSKIIKMDPAQGFAAQGAGAAVILSASHVGFPLSTTQVMSGAIMGAGAAKRLSAVRWGVAGNIVLAWVLTLPCSAAVGALTYGVVRIFGTGSTGPIVVACALLAALRGLLAAAAARPGAGGRVIGDIFEVIWVSLVAGIGITASYSFVVLGTGRSAAARREGRSVAAVAYGAFAAVFLIVFLGGFVYAIHVLLTKR